MEIENIQLSIITDYYCHLAAGISDIVYWSSCFLVSYCILTLLIRIKQPQLARKCWNLAVYFYTSLIFYYTLISRVVNDEIGYDFRPLWSYVEISQGKLIYVVENMMNVLLFMPFGFLCGINIGRNKWRFVILYSFLLSLSVEILQYIMKRGFSEVDDIIHNTLGGILGYGFYQICSSWLKRIKLK